ncbi:hypothetical protein P389DRAFT_198887 [Cystobasidium minutum MCA 4210]|uniref:uncharacterized protein n=1 Tax=Cystobasidium minutum MCA 4210 TaxID=1397322 RepID=UPI0034CDF5F8|eukprot:jgi/Rhomi1/198887/gm1.7101_g
MTGKPHEPSLSASLILLSPLANATADGFDYKVCLLERGSHISNASATVFPGGNLDPVDYEAARRFATQNSNDISSSPAENSASLPLPALRACAVRETFEEVGVLLTSSEYTTPPKGADYKAWRKELSKNPSFFLELYSLLKTSDEQARPPLEELIEWSRWITPTTQPKRFDTTFFLHILPQSSIRSENPLLKADGTETASAEWSTPKEALDRCLKEKKTILFPPQVYLLTELASLPTLREVRSYAPHRRLLTILPRAKAVGREKKHLAFVYPGDPEYEKDGKISDSASRHRTYAEAIFKDGRAAKPKQPLTVRGVVRTGIDGFPDMRIGEIPSDEDLGDKSKL